MIAIADLIARAGLTQEQAARRCGVSLRTIQNWISGKTRSPDRALAILESAADVELELAAPMPLGEQIAVLRHIQGEQHHRCCVLEDELAQARRDLAETSRRLNALYGNAAGAAKST